MADEENTEGGAEEGATPDAVDPAVEEGLADVADAAAGAVEAGEEAAVEAAGGGQARTVDFIREVPLAVTVEVGRARMTIQDLLQLGQGSVVELSKLAGDPLDVYINGKRVARGEAVIVNEKFGVRLTDIISPEYRMQQLE